MGRASTALAAAGMLPMGTSLAAETAERTRPNILLIITDQQHAGMLSCAGNRWLKTPNMDALAARGVSMMRQGGHERDTVVVLVSDHGDMDGAHRLEHKSMLYEEATRVPLIVSLPGVTRQGLVDREHLVSTGLDLIPTLCDFARIAIPTELRGRSVRRLAEGDRPADWRETLVVENEGSRLVRWGDTKYMVYAQGRRREQLVDLKLDPGEMKNVAADPARREQLMEGRRRLRQWYLDHGLTLDPKYLIDERP